MSAFDYIIVGAGSAGCVLASRLSEDPDVQVLLLEAGGNDRHPLVQMPAGVADLLRRDTRFNRKYTTVPQAHLGGRALYWPRGRGLGGSSSINGMIYIRGHARDYDRWAQQGLTGWSYADVLPYFRRAERNHRGAGPFHGSDGPLWASRGDSGNPVYDDYVAAAMQAGFPRSRDFNGFQQEGFGLFDLTIRDGQRCSSASAYLRPALRRSNLKVLTGAQTKRVLMHRGRAQGVEFLRRGKLQRVYADCEVILSGGCINSPQLLMLSGVGAAPELQQHGIPVVCDLPGVGKNLQDHLDCMVHIESKLPVTLYQYNENLAVQLKVGLQYMLNGKGPGREQGCEAGGFFKTRPDMEIPDCQVHFVNSLMMDHARQIPDRHGFTAHVCQLRPQSRGMISLRSANPADAPRIDPNYLAEDQDRVVLREGLKVLREIFAQRAFEPYRGREMTPGPEIRSDADLDAHVRSHAESIYHPVGTCKMGIDETAVVDAELRVLGVEGLRVIDASVMPSLIGGNTNAPTIMLAEKASDLIRGRKPLASEPVLIAEDRVFQQSDASQATSNRKVKAEASVSMKSARGSGKKKKKAVKA